MLQGMSGMSTAMSGESPNLKHVIARNLITRPTLQLPRNRFPETCHVPWRGPPVSLLSTITPSRSSESPDGLSMRTSSDHRFIMGALRARRTVYLLPRIILGPRVSRAKGVIRPSLRLVELTSPAERRSLLLALEPHKEESSWELNRYRIGH